MKITYNKIKEDKWSHPPDSFYEQLQSNPNFNNLGIQKTSRDSGQYMSNKKSSTVNSEKKSRRFDRLNDRKNPALKQISPLIQRARGIVFKPAIN
jgi:hypothetical protein